MPINSRAKGARGERELRDLFRAHGFEDARRGQQYSGTETTADVLGLPGFHVECKRVKSLKTIYRWMNRCEKDSGLDHPSVFMRADDRRWLVLLDAKDLLDMIAELKERREYASQRTTQAQASGDPGGSGAASGPGESTGTSVAGAAGATILRLR